MLPHVLCALFTPCSSSSRGGTYRPPYVDRIWLWVDYNKIPMYPIFYLLKGDYRLNMSNENPVLTLQPLGLYSSHLGAQPNTWALPMLAVSVTLFRYSSFFHLPTLNESIHFP